MFIYNRNIELESKEYEVNMDPVKRKVYGSFYTPEYIVDYMVESTIKCADIIENPFIKILDPACGCGYFLNKVYDVLTEKFTEKIEILRQIYSSEEYFIETYRGTLVLKGEDYWKKENIHYHIIKNCIYGADIDKNAVDLTVMSLLLKQNNQLSIKTNIICCDSLIKWEEDYDWDEVIKSHDGMFRCKYRDINSESKEIKLNESELNNLIKKCNFWRNKYDYVIGNPPWVSLSRKHSKNIESQLVSYYVNKYNGNLYLPNLYEYFIKRAFQLLRTGGIVAFIIPDRFSKNLQYKSLREEILKKYSILNIVFQVVFPKINTDTMIFIAKKEYKENNEMQLGIHNKEIYFLHQKKYLLNANYEFTQGNSDCYKLLKDKIEDKIKFLGDITTTFTGFIGSTKKITKEKISDSQVKILKGENIQRFKVLENYYYEFSSENIIGGTKDISKLACPLKILIRKTGNRLIATLDSSGYIIEQSLYGVINLSNEFSYKYILGIINSKLMEWYYLNYLITNLNSTPQIKKYSLDRIPIKCCSLKMQKNIEGLVDIIMSEVISYSKKELSNEKINNLQLELDREVFKVYDISLKEQKIIMDSLNQYKIRGDL
ncbi:Eco57I restriction-modification methylase domain-containing protein [Clostridium sp. DJ247]|uniref:Eco57I restriction-modification methylase domain-containing protein n=1 Tax=Clostridium sp. DJ247 TaxID=2726188 RepID=UPI001A9BB085|nr:TaqI-like C-terminal specificity domain-containing protein [Clostridium sp. DJ247]MBC2579220.1 N-6 DNA methylase [Clostridium sp. DJ247]MBC2579329.1 N-6 DNA methylase [Clostridium sp. DJ247]